MSKNYYFALTIPFNFKFKYSLTIYIVITSFALMGQNWSTFGGGNGRNGISKMTGPTSISSLYWSQSTSNSSLGNAVYSFGDKFVTSRIIFSPYSGRIECRSISSGTLLWTSPFFSANSIMYAIGFTEYAVYGHDYNNDSLYAFNINNGNILWRSPFKSSSFGGYNGALFTCNGDLIVNGPTSSGIFTMRINKNNGDTVWTNRDLIAITPSQGLAMHDRNLYRLTGGFTTPIVLTAIDIQTGISQYNSAPIPGDPDQEFPITVGPDGTIYFWRDGGKLYAYADNGTSFSQRWIYTPVSAGLFTGNITVGIDNSIYIFDNNKVKKLNQQTGIVSDSSVTFNLSLSTITIALDSTVYLNSGTGIVYALSSNLQNIKWQLNTNNSVYSNPGILKDGVMIITESGNSIRAFKPSLNIKPVADFSASTKTVNAGIPVNFFDQSSYNPTTWQWTFAGAAVSNSTLQNPIGIVYNAPGIYDVKLIAQNANGHDSIVKACQIEVLLGPTLKKDIDINDFNLYPNPFSNFICIESNLNYNDIPYKIVDLSGKILLQDLMHENKINLDFLHPGFYLITLGHQQIKTYKILKQ
jgi:PKD repeat protein